MTVHQHGGLFVFSFVSYWALSQYMGWHWSATPAFIGTALGTAINMKLYGMK